MDLQQIQQEASNMAMIHNAVKQAMPGVLDDVVQKYASGIYIKLNPKQSSYKGNSGGQRKPDVPKELQRGASTNQVKQVGYPCDWCQTPLIESKGGNAYCKCWYEAK